MNTRALSGSDPSGRRGFAVASFQTFLGTLTSRVLLFGLAIATARVLGTQFYGEFAVVQSTAMLLALGLGHPLALVSNRYTAALWATAPAKSASLASSLLSTSVVAGAVVATGMIFASSTLSETVFSRPQLGPFIAVAGVAVVFHTFFLVATATLRGFQFFKAAARAQILQAVIGAPIALLLIWRWGLWGGVLGLVGLWAVGACLALFALGDLSGRLGFRLRFRLRVADLSSVGSFYLPFLLTVVGVAFSNWCVRAILTHGPDAYRQVGLFSAAFQYSQVFQLIVGPLLLVATPLLTTAWSKSEHDSFRRTGADLLRICFIVLAPLSIVAVGCAPWLLALLGPDYSVALRSAEILFLALALDGLLATIGPVLIATEHPWLLASLTGVRTASLVGLTVLLLKKGALGAALAYLASEILLAAAVLAVFLWLREYEPLKIVGRLLLFSLPGFALGALGVLMDLPGRAVVCGLAAAVLALGAWFSLERADRRSLTELVRNSRSLISSAALGGSNPNEKGD